MGKDKERRYGPEPAQDIAGEMDLVFIKFEVPRDFRNRFQAAASLAGKTQAEAARDALRAFIKKAGL